MLLVFCFGSVFWDDELYLGLKQIRKESNKWGGMRREQDFEARNMWSTSITAKKWTKHIVHSAHCKQHKAFHSLYQRPMATTTTTATSTKVDNWSLPFLPSNTQAQAHIYTTSALHWITRRTCSIFSCCSSVLSNDYFVCALHIYLHHKYTVFNVCVCVDWRVSLSLFLILRSITIQYKLSLFFLSVFHSFLISLTFPPPRRRSPLRCLSLELASWFSFRYFIKSFVSMLHTHSVSKGLISVGVFVVVFLIIFYIVLIHTLCLRGPSPLPATPLHTTISRVSVF